MNAKVKIAVDTMGSETPLLEIIEALNESLQRNVYIFFFIFGDKLEIDRLIKNYKNLQNSSEIIDCEEFLFFLITSLGLSSILTNSSQSIISELF